MPIVPPFKKRYNSIKISSQTRPFGPRAGPSFGPALALCCGKGAISMNATNELLRAILKMDEEERLLTQATEEYRRGAQTRLT